MKDVWPVCVNEDAIVVPTIVGVTADVITLFENQDLPTQGTCTSFSDSSTTEPGTDNQAVNLYQNNTSERDWTWAPAHGVLSP